LRRFETLPAATLRVARRGSALHHILVVDDEADICEVVKTGFEAGGKYRVDCATNRLDAFAALRRRPLDLALLDMLMRENAGGEIEAFAGEMRVPVLRMTGHPEIMRKSLAQGLPVLMKPFRVGDLVDTAIISWSRRTGSAARWRTMSASRGSSPTRRAPMSRPRNWHGTSSPIAGAASVGKGWGADRARGGPRLDASGGPPVAPSPEPSP
jgi:DNA-binding NtrC family response regulator